MPEPDQLSGPSGSKCIRDQRGERASRKARDGKKKCFFQNETCHFGASSSERDSNSDLARAFRRR